MTQSHFFPPAAFSRRRPSLLYGGGGNAGIIGIMTPAQRYMVAAAIVFVVGGRIYSDRKPAGALTL